MMATAGGAWRAPEVFCILAEREMQGGALASAAVYLARALETSRVQGALGWELRAAMTAAGLPHLTGDAAPGLALLASVYGRFAEGFSTRDLRAARQLLGRSA